MCGIAGFVNPPGAFREDGLRDLAARAAASLAHRGPDDEGTWTDPRAGVALAFRRLAIIDLSQQGHQPMPSDCGRYVIVYNGEIYNYQELRAALAETGHAFRGHSDTEVLLAAIARWGFKETLVRCNGMFAIALWDREARRLHLARDRMGQKPLYVGWLGDSFGFASELRALRHHPGFSGRIDLGATALFLRYAYVPAPHSIYQDIGKLPPGTCLTLDFRDGGPDRTAMPEPEPYWSATEVAREGLAAPLEGPPDELLDRLDDLLRDAVRLCMVSDVPLGAFLSGGIDSSTVVALMQAQSNRPVRTFSIGFHEAGFDEAQYAAAVAKHLGTDHSELYVTPAETQAVIPKLPHIYDEPFADPSQVPSFLVSQLAQRQVRVSLSGDGGDELFGGYNRYFWARSLDEAMSRTPATLRRWSSALVRRVPVERWDGVFKVVSPLLPRRLRYGQVGHKLHKMAAVFGAGGAEEMYQRLVSLWQRPESAVRDGREPPTLAGDPAAWPALGNLIERMCLLDSLTYLPDDVLAKLDRASMAVGLEGRVPILDHRVVEFSWRVPLDMKLRDGQGKWLLRKLLARYVPPALIERPKMGFGVPIGEWLRGDLRDWAESLLDERRLTEAGILDPVQVRRVWRQHLERRHNWQYQIWAVLMFEAWREAHA